MEIRRLVKSGAASHTVSLPKNWLGKNNLGKGDIVYINEKSDKELLITPEIKEQEKQEKETTISVDKKDLSTIQREITSAYINNYNTIIILGNELNSKVKDVRKMLHDFVALEISELTGSKIVARDLLNLKEISIEKTIRRMDMIVRSIIQDSIESIEGENMYESVYYRDFDVNKLYFLMYRILKSALNDSRVAESFNITNSEAISNWYLAMNIENIADLGKNICESLKDASKELSKQGKIDLKEIYKNIEKSYLDVMKAFFQNDKVNADKIALLRDETLEQCNKFLKKENKMSVYKTVNHIKELLNHIGNIARIVMDAEQI